MAEYILTISSGKDPAPAAQLFPSARKEDDLLDWWKEDRSAYVVTVNTIEELEAITAIYRRVIIHKLDKDYKYPILEIYDAYRE